MTAIGQSVREALSPLTADPPGGQPIGEAEGRAIIAERYTVPVEIRRARRQITKAKALKQRTAQRKKEPTVAAPATSPPTPKTTQRKNVA